MKVLIGGKSIIKKFLFMSKSEIKKSVHKAYEKYDRIQKSNYKYSYRKTKGLVSRRTRKLISLQKELKKEFKRYKSTNYKNPKRYMRKIAKFLKSFGPRTLGVSLLKSLICEEQLYVQGQIYGIHPSTSAQQVFEEPQDRRFMGVSWGRFPGHSPLRLLLKNHNLEPAHGEVHESVNLNDFLGQNQNMMPMVL